MQKTATTSRPQQRVYESVERKMVITLYIFVRNKKILLGNYYFADSCFAVRGYSQTAVKPLTDNHIFFFVKLVLIVRIKKT